MPPTLAISLQLLPASLIIFNLLSSAGVHGVFVLLFLAAVGLGSEGTSPVSALPSGPPYAADDKPSRSAFMMGSTALRLRDAGGALEGCGAATMLPWLSVRLPAIMCGCCGAKGEMTEGGKGLYWRLDGGEELSRVSGGSVSLGRESTAHVHGRRQLIGTRNEVLGATHDMTTGMAIWKCKRHGRGPSHMCCVLV